MEEGILVADRLSQNGAGKRHNNNNNGFRHATTRATHIFIVYGKPG